MRALYFGTYDREHPRNVNAIAAMRAAGVDIVERSVAVRGPGVLGVLSVASAETRLLGPRRHEFDVVIVGYPGHFDVPRARRVAGGRPLVFDAVLSLEDELVGVRRRFRPRSTAATVLRAVDTRALRLPDLVVCGTRHRGRVPPGSGAERAPRCSSAPTRSSTATPGRRPIRSPPCTSRPLRRRSASGSTQPDVPVQIVAPGEIPLDDLGIAVAHAGIVLASFRESRAIPAVVFDALATGAPVVTADTAAARELLPDGESALLVPPDDPEALAAAIRGSPRTRSCARARRRGERYSRRARRRVLGERWCELLAPRVARRTTSPGGRSVVVTGGGGGVVVTGGGGGAAVVVFGVV